MNIFQICIVCVGRILLSSIFLISSILEMMNWASTEQYLSEKMTRWMGSFQMGSSVPEIVSTLLPWISWILLSAIVFKVLGSILLILGWKVRLGSVLLILFLIPTTLIIHDFWSMGAQENAALEMIMFMKNVSILGGLLVVLAFGKGSVASKSH